MAYTIPQQILQSWQSPTIQQQYAQKSIQQMEEQRKIGVLNITPSITTTQAQCTKN
jgi:hypothetical protein